MMKRGNHYARTPCCSNANQRIDIHLSFLTENQGFDFDLKSNWSIHSYSIPSRPHHIFLFYVCITIRQWSSVSTDRVDHWQRSLNGRQSNFCREERVEGISERERRLSDCKEILFQWPSSFIFDELCFPIGNNSTNTAISNNCNKIIRDMTVMVRSFPDHSFFFLGFPKERDREALGTVRFRMDRLITKPGPIMAARLARTGGGGLPPIWKLFANQTTPSNNWRFALALLVELLKPIEGISLQRSSICFHFSLNRCITFVIHPLFHLCFIHWSVRCWWFLLLKKSEKNVLLFFLTLLDNGDQSNLFSGRIASSQIEIISTLRSSWSTRDEEWR